ncbi:hypothetical protein BC939DRAFT_440389 [Gamsiella multidivaricata]|uniref:uncharacterized protein n=1 Tax=Gamsiella multidivaricata TaxID=101098 RepID=UPI00222058EF|nr:uncharacterized protein BC939DRAFT_440389 [Gamsiella multidivaricata]KAI7829724.1 hypothetical protein BC939DRAFT_440389 [Gamsiella multidivaricata]
MQSSFTRIGTNANSCLIGYYSFTIIFTEIDSNSLGFGVPMKYDRAAEEEVKKKAEQDHELQVQKALANLMPNVDWRLIPPQRVINAVLGINQVKGEGGAAGKPKLIIPDGKTPVVATMTTTASEGNESLNGSSPASKDGAAPAATKAKKKKKNKKKRQISSVNAEGTADTDEDDHHHSTEVGQSSNGESGSESHPDTTDSEGEGSGTDGVAHKVAKSNGIGSEDSAMDLEEERRERRKEKKREKKRKSKMNKKNRTSTLAENSESSTDSSSTTTEGEAMEL